MGGSSCVGVRQVSWNEISARDSSNRDVLEADGLQIDHHW